MHSALYNGRLYHVRLLPMRYGFSHRLGFFVFDLEELPDLCTKLRFFGYNRPALFSLYDRDYGNGDGQPLLENIRACLKDHGLTDLGRVLLLTQPRLFGYAFNPVNFFYCLDSQGMPLAIVAEVNNTFGDRHRYVLVQTDQPGHRWSNVAKLLHVSPFFSLQCHYDFYFSQKAPSEQPGSPLEVRIDVQEGGERRLTTRLWGRRGSLSDQDLLHFVFAYPLNTLRIIVLIHYHALRLYLKGARFFSRPPYNPDDARRMHEKRELPGEPAGGAVPDTLGEPLANTDTVGPSSDARDPAGRLEQGGAPSLSAGR